MSGATTLSPASRVFACEYAKGVVPSDGGIFVVGVLTDKIERGDKVSSLRVSDPTGVFSISMNWNNVSAMKTAEELEAPSFVAVYAQVHTRTYAGKNFLELVVGTISETTKDARDSWLCETAASAPQRLQNHPEKDTLLAQISAVLSVVKPKKPAVEVTDEQIFEVIEGLSERKGALLTAVLEALIGLGMSETAAKSRLNQLAEDGDLYSPTKETIKVL